MKPKTINHQQGRLLEPWLSRLLDPTHDLFRLSSVINWERLEANLADYFVEERGAPAKPVRLIVGLLILQHVYNVSDEGVVQTWIQNPYWQFFCGYDFLQWDFPINPSSLTRWRQRIGKEGMDQILAETVDTSLRVGLAKKKA